MKRKIRDLLLLDDGNVYINLPTWELTKQFIIDAKAEGFLLPPLSDMFKYGIDYVTGTDIYGIDIYDTGIYHVRCDLKILYTNYRCPDDLKSKKRKYYLIDYKDYLEGCDVGKCAHNIKKRSLSAGGFCVLVYSDSLKNFYGSPFHIKLRDWNFLSYETHSDWSFGWVYVNLFERVYTLMSPKDELCSPIGDHAVTISEFWKIYDVFEDYRVESAGKDSFIIDYNYCFNTIYEIFKKYEGKDLFVFDKAPFDAPE